MWRAAFQDDILFPPMALADTKSTVKNLLLAKRSTDHTVLGNQMIPSYGKLRIEGDITREKDAGQTDSCELPHKWISPKATLL